MATVAVDRYRNLFLKHVASHTLEMQLAVLSIIAGGGWMVPWLDRMDAHFEGIYGQMVPWLREQPSRYFARQCWVSLEPEERTLGPLADVLGADRILFGSDYPHADATFPGFIETLEKAIAPLPEASRQNILYRNARAFYRL